MTISMILRLMRRSGVRKKPRASCMVSVEPPSVLAVPGRQVVAQRAHHAAVVDAAVLKEAAVLNGETACTRLGGISS